MFQGVDRLMKHEPIVVVETAGLGPLALGGCSSTRAVGLKFALSFRDQMQARVLPDTEVTQRDELARPTTRSTRSSATGR